MVTALIPDCSEGYHGTRDGRCVPNSLGTRITTGGGGSFGGGGADGSWGNDDSGPDIVVTARRTVPSIVIAAALRPNYQVFFGYPPDGNAAHHINRHLVNLTSRQRRQLQAAIRNNILSNFNGFSRVYIGFEVFNGQQYEFRAFLLQNGIINVGTIFRVDD